MPTQNVTASLQGRVGLFSFNIGLNGWLSNIRNASTGSTATTFTTSNSNSQAIRASYASGRSGYSGSIYRSFLFFDVSSVPGTITAATLQIYGYSQSTSDAFIVKSSAWGGNGSTTSMSTDMYNDLDFSSAYSQSSISNWSTSTSSPNQFFINSAGITDMNNNGYLNVALVNYTNDYSATQPILNTTVMAGMYQKNTTYPIRLVITYETGYSDDVIDVVNTNIQNVIDVASGDIGTVIGVPPPPP
tara:strand:+ start:1044 stop:1778 length:735 start_codon:yes stop_codon:yes gene_type:complete